MEKKTFINLLSHTIATKGTELHFAPGASPFMRVGGKLEKMNIPPIEPSEMKAILDDNNLLGNRDVKAQVLQAQGYVFSLAINGLGRFRVSIIPQRGTFSITVRVLPFELPSLKDMNLPGSIQDIQSLNKGLVLVAGTKGTGKATVLAALVDYFNESRISRISTIENPIEYLHSHKMCMVTQREIGADTGGFETALHSTKYEGADIVMVNELPKTRESIMLAVSVAEEKLVLASINTHGNSENAKTYIEKIVNDESTLNLQQFSFALRGFIHLREINGQIESKIDVMNGE